MIFCGDGRMAGVPAFGVAATWCERVRRGIKKTGHGPCADAGVLHQSVGGQSTNLTRQNRWQARANLNLAPLNGTVIIACRWLFQIPNSREAIWTPLKSTEALRSPSASAKALSSCQTALVRSSSFLKSCTESGNRLTSSASPTRSRAAPATARRAEPARCLHSWKPDEPNGFRCAVGEGVRYRTYEMSACEQILNRG